MNKKSFLNFYFIFCKYLTFFYTLIFDKLNSLKNLLMFYSLKCYKIFFYFACHLTTTHAKSKILTSKNNTNLLHFNTHKCKEGCNLRNKNLKSYYDKFKDNKQQQRLLKTEIINLLKYRYLKSM